MPKHMLASLCTDPILLIALSSCRYGRSYDVSLVQRKYLGKQLIALNIM